MVFSSLLFLFRFLPAVLAAYYILPRKCRNLVLFISSLFFYAWGEPTYVFLVLFSTIVDYCAGRMLAYCQTKGYRRRAVGALLLSVVINLGILAYFKYAAFFIQIIHRLTGIAIPDISPDTLPIGISFYTFQTMSYTIDVYRRQTSVQKNFITFGAYVSLFSQLIAGPIVRYRDVAEQLCSRKETTTLFGQGMIRFVIGLGKKVLIANQIGSLWEEISAMNAASLTTATAWLGVLAFTLQIYFDFSGYSDMALGLGKMFGFIFPENFLYPYESKSITEFWRRWHISLGTWFREYVYIPLGGNRKGLGRQMFNIAVVWFLTGLWHGASVNFILWGIYYGILLVIEKLLWKPVIEKLPSLLRHLYTMILVMVGWSIFSWQDMANWRSYTKAMFGMGSAGMMDQQAAYLLVSNLGLIGIAVIGSMSWLRNCSVRCLPEGSIRREVSEMFFFVAVFAACLAMLVNGSYNPFLYFRF